MFSAKGGCGKTTLSTNLAEALALSEVGRVCLVDFNLEFGDVAIALQVDPVRTISDALGMQGGLDQQGVSSMVIPYKDRLDVLLAPTQPADAEFISAQLTSVILAHLAEMYDFVVIDSPPAFSDVILKCFDVADTYVLLSTLDMLSLKNFKLTLDTLDALGYPRSRWSIVLNRCDSKVGLTVEDMERTIGLPVATRLPSTRDVPASLNRGVTLVSVNRRHPFSRAVFGLAARESAGASSNAPSAAVLGEAGHAPPRRRCVMALAQRLGQSSPVLPGASRQREAAAGSAYASDYPEIKAEVQEHLMESMGQQLYAGQIDAPRLERLVFESIQAVLARNPRPLSGSDRARIVQEVIDDVLGNGPLEPLLRDADVTEIMVNRHDMIYMEKGGKIYPTGLRFSDERHLRQTIDRIVSRIGRRVDEASPMVDARLPDGSRVNAVVPPVAIDGSSLTIRKFSTEPFTSGDLIMMGTLTRPAVDFLRACVRGRLNMLISGGTGSGKTTTLNVMSSFIPEDERIITVEDAAELRLGQPHVLRLESRPANVEGVGLITVRDLVRNSLRMRPDRIIVGEVRDSAALDMLQAMNTGHDGSLSTVHANSPRDALSRIETMVLMAGVDLPVRVIREQITQALNLVIHQARLKDGTRHVTQISEIVGRDGDTVLMQDIYAFDYSRSPGSGPMGRLVSTGIVPQFADRLLDRGIEFPAELFQI